MKFLKTLVPPFLNKIDHRLLINKPVIWRTKAHYLLFYAVILITIIFSIGCFYPHSIYDETYKTSENRDNVAIALSLVISIVIIIFWSTRLYQYQMRISKWKHFFYTFCIYFFCLFILFTSVFSFHYGSFINRASLLSNYKSTSEKLVDNNYYLPVYFPHYQEDKLENLNNYFEGGETVSKDFFQLKKDLYSIDNVSYYRSHQGYVNMPVERYELLNLVKEYIHKIKTKEIEIEDELAFSGAFAGKFKSIDQSVLRIRSILSGLESHDENYIKDVKVGEEGYENKANYNLNSFTAEQLHKALELEKGSTDPNVRFAMTYNNSEIASGMLFRYENYLNLKNFINSLNTTQYEAYYSYLEQLDTLEQIQFYLDENTIQVHEISALLSYERVEDDYLLSREIMEFSHFGEPIEIKKWTNRFTGRDFYVDNTIKPDTFDIQRAKLIKEFFTELDSSQIHAYKEYVHFDRILKIDLEGFQKLNVFNTETGLEDYLFTKIQNFMVKKADRLTKLDSVMFFNYFDSGLYSVKLSSKYYPLLIQKSYFDRFYERDQTNQNVLAELLTKNGLLGSEQAQDGKFCNDPNLVYKRQFLFHAFEKIGKTRSDALSSVVFLSFIIANLLGSFCCSILVFYLSSVERNTILFSILITGGILFLLSSFSIVSNPFLNMLSILIYLVFTIGLLIVFYKGTYQIKRIKLITTTYIFYAISIHFFMLANQGTDLIFGINANYFMAILLFFTFVVLFFYSYFFIKYIQLPLKV